MLLLHLIFMVAPLNAVDLTYTSVKYEDEAAGDFRVDFDYYGYLRNPDEYHRIRSTGVLNKDDEDVCDITVAYVDISLSIC